MRKKALVTGITGQDGAYLAEFRAGKDYEGNGVKHRTSLFYTDRIDHLCQDSLEANRNLILHHGNMTNSSSLFRIIKKICPDETHNLATQRSLKLSQEFIRAYQDHLYMNVPMWGL